MHKRTWGIYGGSFDPPHLAHRMVARQAQRTLALERVIWIPSGTPPHKKGLMSEAVHRLAMTRLLVREDADFSVSEMEVTHEGVDYTAVTLQRLTDAYPEAELTFILGGDSLLYLDEWYEWKKICALARIAAVYRPGASMEQYERKADALRRAAQAEIVFIPCPGMDISSTDVRRRAAAGQSLAGLVPAEVEAYIYTHHLYEKQERYGK
ncbi:MAG: nicotinate-nucleotide adenylyltransferase [Eubacteriales bacterium]|nr:nicotinate-nucleotide adenylyltransferase [Eubacteriales bacterium]